MENFSKLFLKIQNLDLGTCLVEPLVATPLAVVGSQDGHTYITEYLNTG